MSSTDLLTCACGSTTFDVNEEVTVSEQAARNAKGRGLIPVETTRQVLRCTECRTSTEELVGNLDAPGVLDAVID